MNTSEVRSAYVKFFQDRGHARVASDLLVPEHDPTLLFTGAGMNQFKDQFLGKNLTDRRVVSCQKCFRADDIDEVGKTPCHHSFFEMLGNFSFGDYFKKGAVEYAWEFLTGVLKLDADKLSVSVYTGDDESYGHWKDLIGVPPERIYRLGEHDNFWPPDAPSKSPAGALCGPCTEIFYDMGPQPHCPDPAKCDITCDCKRHVEIWNLVLQQFEKGEGPGDLQPLAMQNIDTGMGLERTAAVMQGVASNFQIDIFVPIVNAVVEALGVEGYAPDALDKHRGVRRIADFVRAVSFLICDGVLPANESRGYVERRIIRRAMLDGMDLGAQEPFLHTIVPVVGAAMGDVYPQITERSEHIARIIKAEEERFQATLANGSRLLKELAADLKDKGLAQLPGTEAFRLHDTYGLPIEITESILEDQGMTADRVGFEKEMDRQRAQARSASGMLGGAFDTGPLGVVKETAEPTEFIGYDATAESATVAAIIVGDDVVDRADAGAEATLVLDRTPFYGESGGQIGDTGAITADGMKMEVLETLRAAGYILHVGKVLEGAVAVGDVVTGTVDSVRRQAIRRAHTATHLLHQALREVVGEHVEQAGSLVAPDRLRFDFSHFEALTPEELERIEELVNENVLGGSAVNVTEMAIDEAKRAGATALFGEKYGDVVRVVSIGDYSMELCGGTHLDNAAETGLVRIVSESSIAAGTRRVEAVTGLEALEHVRRHEHTLNDVAGALGSDIGRVFDRSKQLIEQVRELKAEVKKLKKQGAGENADDIVAGAIDAGGVKLIAHRTDAKPNDLRELCDVLKRKLGSGVVVLASDAGGKVSLVVGVSKDLTGKLSAGKIIKDVASVVGGGGGGRPDMAQAGGKDISKIDDALASASKVVSSYLDGAG
jgi:alanyl-tRNA synthetase